MTTELEDEKMTFNSLKRTNQKLAVNPNLSDHNKQVLEDYFQKLEQMWKEFKEQSVFEGSKMDFFKDSISYIDIEYHTEAAKQLFDEKRQKNLRKLKEKVK